MLQGSRRQIGGLQILMRGNNMKLLKGKQSENKAQYLHLCAIECKCNQLLSGYFFFFYVHDVMQHCDNFFYLQVSCTVSPGRAGSLM